MSEPLTRQRSEWRPATLGTLAAGYLARLGINANLFTRKVRDGLLRAMVADEPSGLHLSISFVNHRGDPTRYPSWDEIVDARERLLPDDVGFVMHLPTEGEYVSVHPTTFHLWQFPERPLEEGR